jgi:hypothetical protein
MSKSRRVLSSCSIHALFSLLVSLLWVGAAGASGLTIDSQIRSIVADGFVEDAGEGFAEDVEFLDELGLGVFDSRVDADASYESLEVGFAAATGTQTTEINVQVVNSRLEAFGSGGAGMSFDILDPGEESFSEAASDSFFELVFTVDEPAAYTLTTSLSAELDELTLLAGPGPISSLIAAFVELSSSTGGVLHERTVVDVGVDDAPVEDLMRVSGVLLPDTYTIQMGAVANGAGTQDAFGDGVAAFGFDLVVSVPEPEMATMQAMAGAMLLVLGFSSRRRGKR